MTKVISFNINDDIEEKIEMFVRMTGKPRKVVMQEVMEIGLKRYKTAPSQSAKAVLDLISWAEKEKITGKAKDLSTNHNKYAWEE